MDYLKAIESIKDELNAWTILHQKVQDVEHGGTYVEGAEDFHLLDCGYDFAKLCRNDDEPYDWYEPVSEGYAKLHEVFWEEFQDYLSAWNGADPVITFAKGTSAKDNRKVHTVTVRPVYYIHDGHVVASGCATSYRKDIAVLQACIRCAAMIKMVSIAQMYHLKVSADMNPEKTCHISKSKTATKATMDLDAKNDTFAEEMVRRIMEQEKVDARADTYEKIRQALFHNREKVKTPFTPNPQDWFKGLA